MKQNNWLNECKKYSRESIWWLNMLLSKETESVLVRVSALIHNCLKCTHKNECEDKHNLVKFLTSNEK